MKLPNTVLTENTVSLFLLRQVHVEKVVLILLFQVINITTFRESFRETGVGYWRCGQVPAFPWRKGRTEWVSRSAKLQPLSPQTP